MASQSGSSQHQRAQSGGTQDGASPPSGKAREVDEATFYELLNVPMTASKAEITTAYRMAMRHAHPDRVPPQRREAAEALSKLLNGAYATLSDPGKRLVYDRTIRAQEVQDQIMKRYVGGFARPAAGAEDLFAKGLKRDLTSAEKRDLRQAERSAMISVFSVFLVVSLGAIGLLILFSLISLILSRLV